MAQTQQEKIVMMKLRDAGVLKTYNGFGKNIKSALLFGLQRKGIKAEMFDLSDFPSNKSKVLIEKIKDVKSRLINLERQQEDEEISRQVSKEKAKEKFKSTSTVDLEKQHGITSQEHANTFDEVLRLKDATFFDLDKITQVGIKHKKTSKLFFEQLRELDRRKGGVRKPVKFPAEGSPV